MAQILIIDDDTSMCYMLSSMVEKIGHDVTVANTLKEGVRSASAHDFDVVLLDVMLPDGNGLEAIPVIRETDSRPEIIIITGLGDPDGAELAIKSGAWDYIEKASSINSMSLPIIRAIQFRDEKKTREIKIALKREGIIGESSQVRHCLDLVAQAANSDANVLVSGETGTGKELIANAVHVNSNRSDKSFVVVDCAALPETLVESTLFGHAKGAFTGADKTKEGLVKMADGGTLFLDEIGELPLSMQKKFLRVLQERRLLPVGSTKEIKSDFRLIAATNRDLEQMVANGKFREDLLYRVRTLSIVLPPLRERAEDIKDLVFHLVKELCERYGMGAKGISPDLFETLTSYSWPGNVRELVNTMENVFAAAGEAPVLYSSHLPTYFRVEVARSALKKKKVENKSAIINNQRPLGLNSFKDYREIKALKAEKEYLQQLVSLTLWDIKSACEVADLSRPRLYALLKKHHISRSS
jgi:two-component system NtrC family response regulator